MVLHFHYPYTNEALFLLFLFYSHGVPTQPRQRGLECERKKYPRMDLPSRVLVRRPTVPPHEGPPAARAENKPWPMANVL
jgi:hypothetical protein